jgi:phospholipase/carboxylesterase
VDDLSAWPHLFLEGSPTGPVVLTLHGTGGNEEEITQLGRVLLSGQPIISPRGQVSEQGMNRWFRRMGEGVFDVDDVIARAGDLAGFITWARAHYGLGDRPVVAVGFSNGANIASATALLHPDVLRIVLAFSGMYPLGDRDPLGDVSGVKMFLANGDHDPMAPLVSVTRLETVATAHGAEVTRSIRPGGHGIATDEVERAQKWLDTVLDEAK